ncbi:autotransporter assembly complex protein TamA [Noviherbaspirillum sp.]|uniref:autotransporter assembly complex protein TamA n=1 Tax=Noviherbaspirillum sp. TaxID=1926288 RepID=UPI002FE33C58
MLESNSFSLRSSGILVRHVCRLSILIAGLLSCALLIAADPFYRVELTAPDELEKLLTQNLDLFRYRERDDLSDEQLNFMVATVAKQVTKLASTQGYFSPKTDVRVDTVSGQKVISLNVDAGPRTMVSQVSVDVTGAAVQVAPDQAAEAKMAWPLNIGEPFTQEEWSDAKQSGLRVLQRRRFAAARLADSQARILADKNAAELFATYDSGPAFTLGEVKISGTRRYPESIIRNVNPLNVGEEYTSERLLEFQRQLLRTPYFSNAVINIDTNPANANLTPVNVRVTEFPAQRLRGGVGYTTDTGARVEGLYSHYNLFGRAWVLDAQTRVEQRRQLGSLSLSMPPSRGAWVNGANGSVERTTLEGVDLRTRRLGVRRAQSTDKVDTAYSIQYYRDELTQINGAALPEDVLVQPGVHQALVAGIAKTWRDVDDARFPRNGRVLSVEAGVALKGLLTDQTFFRVSSRIREFLPIGERDVVILRGELGAVITEGGNAAVPASLLFRAGGTESVRGYPFQSIGNERNGIVYPTRYIATGGVEYLHWLTESWGGAVFYDVGTATDRWNDKQFFQAIGVGARWRSPVGRVNVDLAYGIQAGSIRPHLSLGVAF